VNASAKIDRTTSLEEENAYLRRELGLSIDATQVAAVCLRWPLSRQQARLLLALHAAGGRTLTKPQLLDATAQMIGQDDDRDLKHIDVVVYEIRRKIGAAMISTSWGAGYALSPLGAETLRSAGL
jgi:DNA-binding response OmpR family regulator